MDRLEELFDLKGKVVIITGALGLLGTELSEAFADCGSHVVVVDRLVESVGEHLVLAPLPYLNAYIAAIDIRRGAKPGQAHHRRQHVRIAHRPVPRRGQGAARGPQDERYVYQRLRADVLLAQQAVIAKEIAVVARERDHRVIQGALLLERRHNGPDGEVDALHHRSRVAPDVPAVFLKAPHIRAG